MQLSIQIYSKNALTCIWNLGRNKRTTHWYNVTYFLLKNHLSSTSSMSLHSGFQNLFILDLFCSNALIILVLIFQIVWIIEFTSPNSPHLSAFFFPFPICCITLTFLSVLKTFDLVVTVAMSSCNHSPVNCRSRNVEGNFRHQLKYHYYCHCPGQ